MQGIWSDMNDGVRYNAVDRSNKADLIATADNFGEIKLYKYPCLTKDGPYKVGRGHSANVQNLKFNKTDDYLISVGGKDRAVFPVACSGSRFQVETECRVFHQAEHFKRCSVIIRITAKDERAHATPLNAVERN